jgi:hypothetical protein
LRNHGRVKFLVLFAGFIIACGCPRLEAQDEVRIAQLFEDAIQALGGDTYLQVKDAVSEGNYFQFDRQGNNYPLIKFNDFTKLPDKSRYELGNRKKERTVTVFNLERNEGWILEGQKDTVEATPARMKEFKNSVKHSIETIFRYRYRDPANKLFYMGPGEGQEVTLELVKILDPENDEVTVYFDRVTKLPAKVEYVTIDKQGVRLRQVDEFSQWHSVQGVMTPLRVDGYVNKRQSYQSFVTSIRYNTDLSDAVFTKPIPPK